MAKVKITGLRKFTRNMRAASKIWGEAAHDALYAEGQRVMDASLIQVPKDAGDLAQSRYVTPPGAIIEIGYGSDYAVIQHEDLSASHSGAEKAKYLEDPIQANKVRYLSRFKKRIADNAKRKGGAESARHPTKPTSTF